jgi:hypothetical protein
MEFSYKIWRSLRRYGNQWKREDYESLYRDLVIGWGKVSVKFKSKGMEIKILNRKDKGKKMPRKMRNYLLSRELEITDIMRVKNPGIRKLSRIEKRAMKKRKRFLPIGIYEGMCEIPIVDVTYRGN